MYLPLPNNIKELINENSVEWEGLELKEGYNPEDIIHTICAFANDLNNLGGGYLVIGFKEDSGKPVFPAVGLDQSQVDAYQKKLRELCYQLEPFYFPLVRPYMYDDKMILVLGIPVGDNRPYKAPTSLGAKGQKRYFIRQASSSAVANQSEEKRLLEQSSKIKFDSRVHIDAGINALEIGLMQEYLKETESDLYDDALNMKLEDLSKSLMIVKGPNDALRPLNAGLLFFTNTPDTYLPGAYVDLIIFKDDEGTEFIQKLFKGPLNKQIRDALEFIKTNVIQEKTRKYANQAETKKIINYPYLSIEEALVNAVYHRSYEVDNRTEVRIFPKFIQIINFPGPIPPVNEVTIQQDRIDVREYRNPRIGQFLRSFKLSEELGTGISTIKKEMKKNGSNPPEFDFGDGNTHFMIILKIHPDWNDEEMSAQAVDTHIMQSRLLTNQEQIILEMCLDGSTYNELLNKIPKEELKPLLESLKQEDYLIQRNTRKFFGLMNFSLFYTTRKGENTLKGSF